VDTGKVIAFRSEEIKRLQGEITKRLGYKLVGSMQSGSGHPATRVREEGCDRPTAMQAPP
jgi:hypothetical protein